MAYTKAKESSNATGSQGGCMLATQLDLALAYLQELNQSEHIKCIISLLKEAKDFYEPEEDK